MAASAVVLALGVLAGAFLGGTRMRAAAAAPASAPSAASAPALRPSATPAPTSTRALGPADPGLRRWDALTGGECIGTFSSPWRAGYRVVACRSPHAAQLTRRVTLQGDDYPRRATLRARLGSTCDSAVRLSAASRYRDLRVTSAYPTAAGWAAGDRAAFCFVYRTGGGALVGNLAATRG